MKTKNALKQELDMIKKIRIKFKTVIFTIPILVITSYGQSVDSLLDKLVQKGILTEREANELRAESDKDFKNALSVRTGLADWVNSFRISGDVRGRFEGFYADHPAFVERNRFRYRARVGFTAQMFNNFEAGLRLTSSEASGTFGGDPISGNTTFRDNASKKFIYIDLAYLKWTPVNSGNWLVSATMGKMENPFAYSDMVFDGDYTPEGFAFDATYKFSLQQSLRLVGGLYALDELGGSTKDPWLSGLQLIWDSKWSDKWSSSLGLGVLAITHDEKLTTAELPDVNRGNFRTAAANPTVHGFNPFIINGSVTYQLDRFPMYTGMFPIRIWGEYMNNPAAPHSADNYAWSTGITFGRSGRKKTWEVGYTYKWLGANAWWEEIVDSDFGAYYAGAVPGIPGGAGYASGTNVKGHIVRLTYSPTDFAALTAKVFLTDLINEPVLPVPDSGMVRLQIDLSLKF